jgi:hypothetical protein
MHITKAITQFPEDIDKRQKNNRTKNHSYFIQDLIHEHNRN